MDPSVLRRLNQKILILFFFISIVPTIRTDELDVKELRERAHSLFMHGYKNYMDHAYPADELMPLSCKGRIRGITPTRGDVDDSLGNFSLTLIDSLDTLIVMQEYEEFERSVNLVIKDVKFDADFIVSVFETNIRVLGGLLSAHLMSNLVKSKFPNRMQTYNGELLKMAIDVGNRLLPAFNTTSGLPYSKINLKYGMLEHLKRQKDTCTACGGTMLLEMAALSRLSGNPIYEEKAKKAMDFLWAQRHRSSDLMGTVLNVHSGDWVRKESGIGAGIDSYYEYCLKAYILLGDQSYLERFNKHYDGIMKYINKGPLFVDVHMHRPTVATRSFMDSLLAFWPGLQVLIGDVKQAIEMHEMLFQVVQKHKFLPEAFTHDFQVHWAEHPLRPEFMESTYFLYRATKDPHYLEVAKQIMESITEYVKVPCGFASIKDVRTMTKEDQMESFVLSETFKYLYMIFSDPDDLIFDPDNYVLTTEAHFLPLSIGQLDGLTSQRRVMLRSDDFQSKKNYVCANPLDVTQLPTEREEAMLIRERTKTLLKELKILHAQNGQQLPKGERLRAWAFSVNNQDHVAQLKMMGIELSHDNGKIHINHNTINAVNPVQAKWGEEFMKEMVQYVNQVETENENSKKTEVSVQVISWPNFGHPLLVASPAQFGIDPEFGPVEGQIVKVTPFRACKKIENAQEVRGHIAIVERSDCMFQEKAKFVQEAGAIGMIVIDHEFNKPSEAPFLMAKGENPIHIQFPAVFLYRLDAIKLIKRTAETPGSTVRLGKYPMNFGYYFRKWLENGEKNLSPDIPFCPVEDGNFVTMNKKEQTILIKIHFEGTNVDSPAQRKQEVVEMNCEALAPFIQNENAQDFLHFYRTIAYTVLGYASEIPMSTAVGMLDFKINPTNADSHNIFRGTITKILCSPNSDVLKCEVVT